MYLEQENGKYYFRGESKTVWKADENITTLTVKLYKENRKFLETPVELLNGEYLYTGDVIEITCAAASHYTPDLRVNGQAVTLSSNKAYVVIDGATSIVASSIPDEYTVTLEANDGVITDGKDVTSYTYGVGAVLPTEDDITKEGSTFDGWFADAEFTDDAVTEIGTTDTGDKTFYAKWTEIVQEE